MPAESDAKDGSTRVPRPLTCNVFVLRVSYMPACVDGVAGSLICNGMTMHVRGPAILRTQASLCLSVLDIRFRVA